MKKENISTMINLGDTISIGPFPAETIDLLIEMEANGITITNLEGNHDEIVRRPMNELKTIYHYTDNIIKHEEWTLQQLNEKQRNYILNFRREYQKWGCYFSHYPHDQKTSEFLPFLVQSRYLTPDKQPSYQKLDDAYSFLQDSHRKVFCGHDHFGFDVYSPETKCHYLNPGSFGVSNLGQAPYYVLTVTSDHCFAELMHVEYDLNIVIEELSKRNVPDKEFISEAFFSKN